MDTSMKSNFRHISQTVQIVGVEVNDGQGHNGPQLAPDEIRKAGLLKVLEQLGWEVKDLGNITHKDLEFEQPCDQIAYKFAEIKNSVEVGALCKKLHDKTKAIGVSRNFCLTLGGDHGLATGSISGLKAAYPNLKVIWVDAHADANTPETSPSGNYHGMPVAHLMGWIGKGEVLGFDWFTPNFKSEDLVYIGLRDLDQQEKQLLKKNDIKCFTMHEVDKYSIGNVVDRALQYLDPECKDYPIHISFDIDSIDPILVHATGTKARGGLSCREAHYILREVTSTGNLVGLDLVEINPLMEEDTKPRKFLHGDNPLILGTPTIALGVELIASALGSTLK